MRGRKTGGRRKGTPNKVTAEARAVCAAILDDPTYRTNLTARARAWRHCGDGGSQISNCCGENKLNGGEAGIRTLGRG